MARIRGNNRANTLNGTNGNDLVEAKGGDDLVRAGNGNDTVLGADGNDTIYGGFGNDVIDGGSGIDTVAYVGDVNAPYNRGVTVDLAAGLATGSEGTDALTGIENVSTTEWSDWIRGDNGDNHIWANGGSDTIFVSGGSDTIDGGAGIDALDFSSTGAATVNMAGGTYAIAGGSGQFTGIEHLLGSAGGDSLAGDAGANRIDGRDGDDTLSGGAGNDDLWGGRGSDVLIADGGDDTLYGDRSFDGDRDNAADTFVIATGSGTITIHDFELGNDKLDLTWFGFDQNGVSAYWTGSAQQCGYDTVLTLTGQGSEQVTIVFKGMVEGHLLSMGDMIGGSASLIAPPPLYPMNGGNGQADVFVIDPLNGDVTITGFENGLDRLDISGFIHNGWDGYLSTAGDGSVEINFYDYYSTDAFTVTLTGVGVPLIDASDYVM